MTSDSLELVAAARRAAERAWRDGYAFTKAGILLDDLLPVAERPQTLFEGDTSKRDRLMGALDAINGRFGTWTAVTATQGFKREWKLRSEMRSPAWTTNLAEVPSVRAEDRERQGLAAIKNERRAKNMAGARRAHD